MFHIAKDRTPIRNNASIAESLQRKHIIQTKLTIGKSNDKYEAEADRVADKVVNNTSKPALQKKCAACEGEEKVQKKPIIQKVGEDEEVQPKLAAGIQKMEEEEVQSKLIPTIQKMEEEEETQAKPLTTIQKKEEEETVQTKAETSRKQTAPSWVSQKIQDAKGKGDTMSDGTRSFMENRFGSDFGNVKIHNNTASHELSTKLNAQAFTVGNDVYFNRGKYNPESSSGKHLLAHELTHTVQQTGGVKKKSNENLSPIKRKSQY